LYFFGSAIIILKSKLKEKQFFEKRKTFAGSLAGAAHLLKNNTDVQRSAQLGQKPNVENKVKSWLDFYFQYK